MIRVRYEASLGYVLAVILMHVFVRIGQGQAMEKGNGE